MPIFEEVSIKVNINDNQEPVISGRELHKTLQIKTEYAKWFSRMIEYGFVENQDFTEVIVKNDENSRGGRPSVDHAMKLDMSKEIAMIQRNERGRQVRQYFLQIEKDWNSPEKIMARALRIAEQQINTLKLENAQQTQIICELQPKATYYDLILQSTQLMPISLIAKDYGTSARAMNKKLHDLGVQYSQSGTWLLYAKYQDKGYTQSKTQPITHKDGSISSTLHTQWTQKGRLFIYDLLKQQGVLPVIEREDAKC